MPDVTDLQKTLQEIHDDALYTAQTHFECAKKANRKPFWLITFTSGIAAFLAFLSIAWPECPKETSIIVALCGFISALSSWLHVEKEIYQHRSAGNRFTTIRHKSQNLINRGTSMSESDFANAVQIIENEYQILTELTETTDNEAFKEARDRIKKGFFKYDSKEKKTNS